MLALLAAPCLGVPLPDGSLRALQQAKATGEALGLTGPTLASFILQSGAPKTAEPALEPTTKLALASEPALKPTTKLALAVEPALERVGLGDMHPVPAAHANNAIGAARAELERGEEKTSVVKFQDNTDEYLLSPDFVNIDYLAQGYNIYFGNPLPTRAGVDPGYSDHAGEMIFELSYDQERTTGFSNGAFNLPDGVYALNDAGCKLAYTATSFETQKAYVKELSVNVGLSGGRDGVAVSGSFSASVDYNEQEEENAKTSTETIITKAECVVFHATMPEFETRPKFTRGFKKAVLAAMRSSSELDRRRVLYEMFDKFGTHFPTSMRFGSRYGMYLRIASSEASKFGSTSLAVSAAIALNKEIEEDQKCDESCDEKKARLGTNRGNENEEKEEKAAWGNGNPEHDNYAQPDYERETPGALKRHGRTARAAGTLPRSVELLERRLAEVEGEGLDAAPSFLETESSRPHPHKEGRAQRPPRALERHAARAPPARLGRAGDMRSQVIQILEKRHARREAAAAAGDVVATLELEQERGDMERRKAGANGAATVDRTKSESKAASLAKSSSSMEMISLGAPPMSNVEEWAQQSFESPMPISVKLQHICTLVASVVTGKQVASIKQPSFLERGDVPDTGGQAPDGTAGTDAPVAEETAVEEKTSVRQALEEELADELEVVFNYNPDDEDDALGTGIVRECLNALSSYCTSHLKLGNKCNGPQERPIPKAYSACQTDSDCAVVDSSSSQYTLVCVENNCTPKYDVDVSELKFLAAGPGSDIQTCEDMPGYVEKGCFMEKNRPTAFEGQGTDTPKQKNRQVGSGTEGAPYHVATKLCGKTPQVLPGEPICDVLQVGGETKDDVERVVNDMAGGLFDWKPIPAFVTGGTTGAYKPYKQLTNTWYFPIGGTTQFPQDGAATDECKNGAGPGQSSYYNCQECTKLSQKCEDNEGLNSYGVKIPNSCACSSEGELAPTMEDSFEKRGLFMTQWGLTEGPPYIPPQQEDYKMCEDGDQSWLSTRALGLGPNKFCLKNWPSYEGDISCARPPPGTDSQYPRCPYRHEQIIDECKYVMLYTTARGCNTLQPGTSQMSCVRFVKTLDPATPYGAEDTDWMTEHNGASCDAQVLETWSGWCECLIPGEGENTGKVVHAVKDATRHPLSSRRNYTCKEECENPTLIPAIKDAKMAYTTQAFASGSDLAMGFEPFSTAATCKGDGFEGYTSVEYHGTCKSLNSRLDKVWTGNTREAQASKLCIKR